MCHYRTQARSLSLIIDSDQDDCQINEAIPGVMPAMPVPFNSIRFCLMKQENDVASGNRPFTQTVCKNLVKITRNKINSF